MDDLPINVNRQEVHVLVDHVRESDLDLVKGYLRGLIDPFQLTLLMAEIDDEPLTDHERAALDEAEYRRQRGEGPVAHGEVLRQVGLSEGDVL